MKKVIGLSFSFCVRDIADGRIKLEQVEKIVTATAAPTPAVWDELIESYKASYWDNNPVECERIARYFIDNNKVEQPRLSGQEARNIAAGHWLVNGRQTRNPLE